MKYQYSLIFQCKCKDKADKLINHSVSYSEQETEDIDKSEFKIDGKCDICNTEYIPIHIKQKKIHDNGETEEKVIEL